MRRATNLGKLRSGKTSLPTNKFCFSPSAWQTTKNSLIFANTKFFTKEKYVNFLWWLWQILPKTKPVWGIIGLFISNNAVLLFLYILINFASNYFPLFTLFIEKLKRSRCVNGCSGTCAFRHVSRVPRVAPVSVMSKSTSERWLVVPTVPIYDICPVFYFIWLTCCS